MTNTAVSVDNSALNSPEAFGALYHVHRVPLRLPKQAVIASRTAGAFLQNAPGKHGEARILFRELQADNRHIPKLVEKPAGRFGHALLLKELEFLHADAVQKEDTAPFYLRTGNRSCPCSSPPL